jgi:hypothetical protein
MRARIVAVKIANKDHALESIPGGKGMSQMQIPTSRGTKKRHNCVMVLSLKMK